jgi:hypothetical protein
VTVLTSSVFHVGNDGEHYEPALDSDGANIPSISWWIDPAFHAGGECWDGLAKWPDGKPFDEWDVFFEAPGSVNERDRWRELIRQKLEGLRGYQAASGAIERLGGRQFLLHEGFAPLRLPMRLFVRNRTSLDFYRRAL